MRSLAVACILGFFAVACGNPAEPVVQQGTTQTQALGGHGHGHAGDPCKRTWECGKYFECVDQVCVGTCDPGSAGDVCKKPRDCCNEELTCADQMCVPTTDPNTTL